MPSTARSVSFCESHTQPSIGPRIGSCAEARSADRTRMAGNREAMEVRSHSSYLRQHTERAEIWGAGAEMVKKCKIMNFFSAARRAGTF